MYALKSSDGDYYDNLQLGGTTFNIGAQTTFEYHYMNSAFEVSNKTGFNLDHLYGWKYSGATLCFDIKPTDTVTTDNTVKFSILGDNIRRLSVSLKDRNGEWNRLSAIMTIDLNAMTADHGTLTEKGDGWYSYKLDLSETPLNNNGGEVAYGDETLKMMYFSYVGHSFCFANVSYELDQVTETNQKDLAGATIEPIPDQDYNGKPLFPELTVKYEDETLVFGEDYLVEYSDNDAGGTATVTITPSGVGAHKWKGEKSVAFNIVAPQYVVRGDYFASADNYIYDVDPKAYSTVTFDYYIVSGESFGIALINEDWGSNYFGYLKFNSDGAVESYAGVSCVKCADGYVSVTINMSELTKAVGTPSDKVVRTLFISKNQGDASGYIDNLSFNE